MRIYATIDVWNMDGKIGEIVAGIFDWRRSLGYTFSDESLFNIFKGKYGAVSRCVNRVDCTVLDLHMVIAVWSEIFHIEFKYIYIIIFFSIFWPMTSQLITTTRFFAQITSATDIISTERVNTERLRELKSFPNELVFT